MKIKALFILLAFMVGCQPGKHHGHVYIHDPKHIEVVFDRPMSMSVEKDGVKIEASSIKPGFFEGLLNFMMLRPK